ncbi:hypothetical protein QQZ08_012089 [Neonectria magnoliae]|uniref:ABC transporter domain-containing protein n=1 Tax=Neonectria magnoliae TaxID=2732573 RepID=A0ABR1H558_9HYPO
MAELQAELEERRLDDLESRALKLLSCLGFSDSLIHAPLHELSGGWQMRAMLPSVLIQDADIMVLDEPTNFLDMLGIVWLQKGLVDIREESSKTVITIAKNMKAGKKHGDDNKLRQAVSRQKKLDDRMGMQVKLVTDVAKPTKGTISRHPRLKLGYYIQSVVEDLRAAGKADPSKSLGHSGDCGWRHHG